MITADAALGRALSDAAPVPPCPLAGCASDPARSRGRLVAEDESATRSVFQRDRDRIIHSAAFRRLQYKTQVFVYHEGENYRTRLTHSIEVAQIARSVARVLGLNEDLAEALALAHDLGHTCFGHAGEAALKACMAPFGGFDHNAQTLRIVTKLEHRYAAFDGLNLTWEALEGLVKHNGPLVGPLAGDPTPLPLAIQEYAESHDLELETFPGPEAQVAALSDDIAYGAHDIDDGLRAGLFTEQDLRDVPLAGPVFRAVSDAHPGLERSRLIHEAVRRLINAMVGDLCRRPPGDLPRTARAGRGCARHAPPAGGVLGRNDGQRRCLQGFPVSQHVPPPPRQPHDQQGPPCGARPVRPVPCRTQPVAGDWSLGRARPRPTRPAARA